MGRIDAWLGDYPWDFVVAQNAALCAARQALHKPTSDGYDPARMLWESRFSEPMRLLDAVEICRRCHELAPFCFYNGNTFVAIIRDVIGKLPLSSEQGYLIRSLAGHIVAGVADISEQEAFGKFCTHFESGG
jgi:hypothetical protein